MSQESPYFEPIKPEAETTPEHETLEEKVPFDPWAISEKPTGTNKVNVIPKPPGRNRVLLHTGRQNRFVSLPGLKALENEVMKLLAGDPHLTDEEIIREIKETWKENKTPRSKRFADSTIQNLIKLHRIQD